MRHYNKERERNVVSFSMEGDTICLSTTASVHLQIMTGNDLAVVALPDFFQ